MIMRKEELKYLKAIAKEYPTVSSAATEIINLNAILNLPKGTEHFLTDLHGEYEQFLHVLKNGSGAIRNKLNEEFGPDIREEEKKELAVLIYYPEQKLHQIRQVEKNLPEWYQVTLYRLIRVCKAAGSKYTRSKMRKAMPSEFAYIMEELLSGHPDMADQEGYYNEIISSIIETERAPETITAFCNLIRRLVVDHLHIIGDIYDRGPSPHLIMDTLMKHHSMDIQWGNHDVLWMGAASGSAECMANLLRISARYGNLDVLEDAYGINLIPLVTLAMDVYGDDPCDCFKVKKTQGEYEAKDALLDSKVHKAISVIQFKLEGQCIKRRPDFNMDNRLLLDKINPKKKTVTIDGKDYPMKDMNFPTINWKNPYKLTKEEEQVVSRLLNAFKNSEKLQKHIRFLYSKGNLYKTYNGNLLYHGCVPLNEDGSFKEVSVYGKKAKGKALFDLMEVYARKGYYSQDSTEKKKGEDLLWYMWEGANSPLFGKAKMTTFERYFVEDEETHKEPKDPYYKYIEHDEDVANNILEEFGLEAENSHVINGHVPVAVKKGQSPIKCNGKVLIIDGGFSKAYQGKTGIAGYTLIFNSYGMVLAAHEPFTSIEHTINEGIDIHSNKLLVESAPKRITVGDTDIGKELKTNVEDLKSLLKAYRSGIIAEK